MKGTFMDLWWMKVPFMDDRTLISGPWNQAAALPEKSRNAIRAAVDECETLESFESLCAKDADKLEMLLQAVEYRDVGVNRVDGWIDSARKGVKTETARKIAEAALTISPLAWRER